MGTVILSMWIGGAIATTLSVLAETTSKYRALRGHMPDAKTAVLAFLVCLSWPITLPASIYLDCK
jgi:hypothetical protein